MINLYIIFIETSAKTRGGEMGCAILVLLRWTLGLPLILSGFAIGGMVKLGEIAGDALSRRFRKSPCK